AARSFRKKEVSRIVITRPAIEAGEKLGFLPGDLQEKVDPYLRPLYDALSDIFGTDAYSRMRERGIIKVAPLAYMRGRTLDEAFIILDEAQNTTKDQMKMFLSRFGYDSKVVVNGDITQIDLPAGRLSGLMHACEILQGVEDIAIVNFKFEDVVRHSLVKKILARYEQDHS
ncbi:MAG TPA: PhoH family protein, partial [Tissierellia bacterium]|nr:PhoH family protein [Tissierellia bacterium]